MEVTLSNGIKLIVKAVSPFAVKKVQEPLAGERPKVPKVYLKDQDREIEVPENPDYIKAVELFEAKVAEATYDAMIILGTKPAEVPEGISKIADTDWSDDLALVGIPVPADGRGRYLCWVKYYVCAADADLKAVLNAISRCCGVKEEDALKAAERFRSST